MIEKELEVKLIKWLQLENEVMTEVNKRLIEGKITPKEWNVYFTSMVKIYGNKDMLKLVKSFILLQDILLK